MNDAVKIIQTAMKFKAVMIKEGKTRARTKCPRCKNEDNTLWGQLNSRGPNRPPHIHMRCKNPGCNLVMME